MISRVKWQLKFLLLLLTSASLIQACGGIHALAAIKKDDTEICAVGVFDCLRKQTSLSKIDEEDKQVFLHLLAGLIAQNEPKTAYLLFRDKLSCAKEMLANSAQMKKKGFYMPIESAVAHLAAQKSFEDKGVIFVTPDEPLYNNQFDTLNYCIGFFSRHFLTMASELKFPFECPADLEETFSQNAHAKKTFFSRRGGFEQIRNYIKKMLDEALQNEKKLAHACIYSPHDFLERVDKDIAEIQLFLEQHRSNEPIKRRLLTAQKNLLLLKTKAQHFFSMYTPAGGSCADALLNAMKTTQALMKPITEVLEFMSLSQGLDLIKGEMYILNASKNHKRILFATDLNMIRPFYELFREFGFKGVYSGRKIPAGSTISINKRAFEENELWLFFRNAFSQWKEPLAEIFRHPAFKAFEADYEKMVSDYLAVCPEARDEAIPYFRDLENEGIEYIDDKGVSHDAPLVQEIKYLCGSCGHSGLKHQAFGTSLRTETYCSVGCFLEEFLKENTHELIKVLLSTLPLTAEHISLLQQLAVFCSYQYKMLSTSIFNDSLPFYHAEHDVIAKIFERIIVLKESQDPQASSWKMVAELAKTMGIQLENLKTFFQLYSRIKQMHCRQLVSSCGKETYQSMDASPVLDLIPVKQHMVEELGPRSLNLSETFGTKASPVFDDKDIIKKIQKNNCELICKQLGLAPDTKMMSISHFYYELLQRILNRCRRKIKIMKQFLQL